MLRSAHATAGVRADRAGRLLGLLSVTHHIMSCRLVFIGRNLDAGELNASFRDCLVDNLVISG
jgi:Cobalamin synthesis protein cobW C-terminal domain